MISDKQLRNSNGTSDIELGLNSYASFVQKKSVNTQSSSLDGQGSQKGSVTPVAYSCPDVYDQTQLTVQQLRLKLLKLTDYKANMQQRFRKQIILMNNQLNVMTAETQLLTQTVGQVRKDVQEMRADLQFVKRCVQNKQMRLSVSPDFARSIRQDKLTEKQAPKSRPSKLFKPNMLKIK